MNKKDKETLQRISKIMGETLDGGMPIHCADNIIRHCKAVIELLLEDEDNE